MHPHPHLLCTEVIKNIIVVATSPSILLLCSAHLCTGVHGGRGGGGQQTTWQGCAPTLSEPDMRLFQQSPASVLTTLLLPRARKHTSNPTPPLAHLLLCPQRWGLPPPHSGLTSTYLFQLCCVLCRRWVCAATEAPWQGPGTCHSWCASTSSHCTPPTHVSKATWVGIQG
jgi:hypothetical protein